MFFFDFFDFLVVFMLRVAVAGCAAPDAPVFTDAPDPPAGRAPGCVF